MEEIKVGEYVRIKHNGIFKIDDIDFERLKIVDSKNRVHEFEDLEEMEDYIKNDITKHSPNIIDVIEVGDYVNGEKVTDIYDENEKDEIIQLEFSNCGNYKYFTNDDVKNIVTHEQFNGIKYEVI